VAIQWSTFRSHKIATVRQRQASATPAVLTMFARRA
jgi:hypothetical protein